MRYCNGKMRFFCHLLIATFAIDAAFAANVTSSTTESETKNKRQVNQFLRTPGSSAASAKGSDTEPQAFPLQLSHGIYSQQRVPLYTRRPTAAVRAQAIDDDDDNGGEQEPQQKQQQQQQLPSYYNYVPDIDEDVSPDTGHIDSRNLPVEPRNKAPLYQSTPPQRIVQLSYSSVAPKQSTPSQTLISEDEYLDLIRNTDLIKSPHAISTKQPYGYVTGAATTAADNIYEYSTKSPFNNNEYKKYPSRTHVTLTASSPVPHLQPQTSQQQFIRQSPQQQQPQLQTQTHYVSQQPQYVTAGPSQNFAPAFEKETVRVNLKKYHENTKNKYDPSRGQYHQEVSVKPTKKVVSFKPSYQYASTPQTQYASTPQAQYAGTPQSHFASSNQHAVAQSQPLHYQSVQQISQTDTSKSGQQQIVQPQSQYSLSLPQSQAQQAYYPSESNHPFQSFIPHNDRLVANNFGQSVFEQQPQPQPQQQQHNLPTAPSSQIENKPNGHNDFRIQYVHHVSPSSATPTPTPRTRFVADNTQDNPIPLKYELYDQNGNGNVNSNGNVNVVKELPPKIKLIQRPQYVDQPQPQFYKKVKIQPQHYVPLRPQYHPSQQQQQHQHQHQHQPILAQQSQPQGQAQSDILIPIQPSRSTLFVAPNTGHSEGSPTNSAEKLAQPVPPTGHEIQRKPPLPITSPKKPISQAEFQALLDAGYKVQAIPVPVPVPVSAEKFKQLQRPQHQQQPQQHIHQGHPGQRQATSHYVRYHPKEEDGIFTSYLKPLIDYIGGPSQ